MDVYQQENVAEIVNGYANAHLNSQRKAPSEIICGRIRMMGRNYFQRNMCFPVMKWSAVKMIV